MGGPVRVSLLVLHLGCSHNVELTLGADIRAGLDDIKRLGGWNKDVCMESYVTNAPLKAVLALAGCPMGGKLSKAYFDERFYMHISDDELQTLQGIVYPWLSTFELQVALIQKKERRKAASGCAAYLKMVFR